MIKVLLFPLRVLAHAWVPQLLTLLVALLCCVPLFWHDSLPHEFGIDIAPMASIVFGIAVGVALLHLILTALVACVRLRYAEMFCHLLSAALVWAAALFGLAMLAVVAKLPAPDTETDHQHVAEAPHTPNALLLGPEALHLNISPQQAPSDKVLNLPALTQLESQHEELLQEYLQSSLRWRAEGDEHFYSQPGHVVFTENNANQGIVHAAFCHLHEGAPVPRGYVKVSPGDPMPQHPVREQEATHVPDLALHLGQSHYLLLAWRGVATIEHARQALNASLQEIEHLFTPLAENPTQAQVQQMLRGKTSYLGEEASLRLSEPPSQYGAYQAEAYVNPGEAGTLILIIKEQDEGLRMMSCQASFSTKAQELFRHDFPAQQTAFTNNELRSVDGRLSSELPLFSIKDATPHKHFNVNVELWFAPAKLGKKRRLILQCPYRVQACDYALTENSEKQDDTPPPQEIP